MNRRLVEDLLVILFIVGLAVWIFTSVISLLGF